jgi:hypothetical protein
MQIEVPDSFIDEIAERVRQKLGAEVSRHDERSDPKALQLQRRLALIHVKERISIAEAALLLNCSDGHIRNLVKKAKKNKTKNPIPFCDLDGVTVFNRLALLDWAEQSHRTLQAA